LSKSAAESAACLTFEWKNGLSAADHLVLLVEERPSALEERRFSAASNVSQTGALAPAAADKK
jgi:hypothetical protein